MIGEQPFFNDAVAATKVQVKGYAGLLYALKLVNSTGSTAYLQVFHKAAADVTVGTTVADYAIRLAANESWTLLSSKPIGFDNGLTLAGTTTAGGNTGAAISVFAVYE
jgi:hypothetical protein